jgi:hypothetical protein
MHRKASKVKKSKEDFLCTGKSMQCKRARQRKESYAKKEKQSKERKPCKEREAQQGKDNFLCVLEK